MKKMICAVVFFIAVQCIWAQDKSEKEVALIKSARAASNEAIAKHDIDGISKYWLNDFVQVRGNSTHLSGKDTIIASWKQLFKENPDVAYIRNPSQIIISTNDTLAWETGTWKAIHSYSKGGNYTAMWRKSGNSWMIQAELFVSLH